MVASTARALEAQGKAEKALADLKRLRRTTVATAECDAAWAEIIKWVERDLAYLRVSLSCRADRDKDALYGRLDKLLYQREWGVRDEVKRQLEAFLKGCVNHADDDEAELLSVFDDDAGDDAA